ARRDRQRLVGAVDLVVLIHDSTSRLHDRAAGITEDCSLGPARRRRAEGPALRGRRLGRGRGGEPGLLARRLRQGAWAAEARLEARVPAECWCWRFARRLA